MNKPVTMMQRWVSDTDYYVGYIYGTYFVAPAIHTVDSLIQYFDEIGYLEDRMEYDEEDLRYAYPFLTADEVTELYGKLREIRDYDPYIYLENTSSPYVLTRYACMIHGHEWTCETVIGPESGSDHFECVRCGSYNEKVYY